MIRLVNQFDPPQRRASVATATCCSCCCCCCCLISAVGLTTFTAANLSASAKKRDRSATGQAIGAGFALCIFLPVIGAALALGSLPGSDLGSVVLFSLVLLAILGVILAGLYWSAHERRAPLAGFLVAGVGSAIAIGEALMVLYGLISPAGPAILVIYLLLLLGGIWLATYLGPKVDWDALWHW